MSLYAFHLGQIISTVLGMNDHDEQHGICQIQDEMPEMSTPQYGGFHTFVTPQPNAY